LPVELKKKRFMTYLLKYPKNKLVVHPLDGHANPFAHELMAKEIYNFMKHNNLFQDLK